MNRNNYGGHAPEIRDYGAEPLIVNIDCFAQQNPYYRTALWTGNHLQVTLMAYLSMGISGLKCIPILTNLYALRTDMLLS